MREEVTNEMRDYTLPYAETHVAENPGHPVVMHRVEMPGAGPFGVDAFMIQSSCSNTACAWSDSVTISEDDPRQIVRVRTGSQGSFDGRLGAFDDDTRTWAIQDVDGNFHAIYTNFIDPMPEEPAQRWSPP